MDEHDIEWRCACGYTNPDFGWSCRGCGHYRYFEDEATTATPALTDAAEVTADRNYSGSDTSKITAPEVTK